MNSNICLNVYVDTNVLINYCTGQQRDVAALNYLFSQRSKERLFTSSLSIVQTITNLQTKKSSRRAFSKDETVDVLNRLMSKFTILNLSKEDIEAGFVGDSNDIEDNIHYVLSQKRKCDAIITNNIKDFNGLAGVSILSPNANSLYRKIR